MLVDLEDTDLKGRLNEPIKHPNVHKYTPVKFL